MDVASDKEDFLRTYKGTCYEYDKAFLKHCSLRTLQMENCGFVNQLEQIRYALSWRSMQCGHVVISLSMLMSG